jgi:hypothetical protein
MSTPAPPSSGPTEDDLAFIKSTFIVPPTAMLAHLQKAKRLEAGSFL